MISRPSIFHVFLRLAFAVGLLRASQAHAGSAAMNVIAIEGTDRADLLFIDAGLGSGLRQGMTCLVFRGGQRVAELLLVDARQSVSSALIVRIAPAEAVKLGDTVSVKTFKTLK